MGDYEDDGIEAAAADDRQAAADEELLAAAEAADAAAEPSVKAEPGHAGSPVGGAARLGTEARAWTCIASLRVCSLPSLPPTDARDPRSVRLTSCLDGF
jgi:hypothetical protein